MGNYIRIFLIGMAMGVANIIPGVSGGTIAVVFGIYEQLMEALGNFATDKKNRKQHITFLSLLFGGSLLAVITLASLLTWSYENYPMETVYFFMGLILGSIPVVIRSHDDMKPSLQRIAALTIGLATVVILAILQSNTGENGTVHNFAGFGIMDYGYFLVCGIIASSAMIIPGISGSFILILLGAYWIVLGALSGLTTQIIEMGLSREIMTRLMIIASLGVGVIIGILGFSRIMDWALKKYPAVTMYSILGLIIGSFYQIYPGFEFSFSGFMAVVTFIAGIVIALKFAANGNKEIKSG